MAKRGPRKNSIRPATFPDLVDGHMMNIARFESKIIKGANPQDCWIFTGPKHRQGYGFTAALRLSDQKKIQMTAHRASYRIHKGPITQPNINHTCHNPACVNPLHLYQGTQRENIRDMIASGRANHTRSPYRTATKITPVTTPEGVKRNRDFKYSEAEIQFLRTASLDDIQARYSCTRRRASGLRSDSRRGYRWLPWP